MTEKERERFNAIWNRHGEAITYTFGAMVQDEYRSWRSLDFMKESTYRLVLLCEEIFRREGVGLDRKRVRKHFEAIYKEALKGVGEPPIREHLHAYYTELRAGLDEAFKEVDSWERSDPDLCHHPFGAHK